MHTFRFLLIAAMLMIVAVPIGAEETEPVVLVLDASGSMWGRLGGTPKITVAVDVIRSMIDDLPDDATCGLIIYGHRRKGDCDDVEIVVGLGPIDKPALRSGIHGLNPKGKTPITRSIRAAAELLAQYKRGGTVVLISDGKETCDADPCAAVAALRAAHAKVTVHVIGFDVSNKERTELECLAAAGGGKYFDANSATDLEFAARTATVASVAEAPASGTGKVWIDPPTTVIPGGALTVHFEAADTFHHHAWLGIVPAGIEHGSEQRNDQNDLSYRYLKGQTEGSFTLAAPAKPGAYDIRLHDSDHNGREVASTPFRVELAAAHVWLDTSELTGTHRFTVHFTVDQPLHSSAWIGIVPSAVEHGSEATNDQHEVAYEYLRGRTSGSLELQAPAAAGAYDVRLNDNDAGGSELAYASFTVTSASGRVWLEDDRYAAGTTIDVHFEAASPLGQTAWIGVVPPEIEHGSASRNDQHDVSYAYVRGQQRGVVMLKAPNTPGDWEVRLHDSTGSDGNELAHASFTVDLASAELHLDRTRFSPGDSITVHFSVNTALADNAWAGVVPSDVPHGSEATNDAHDLSYRYLRGQIKGTLEFAAPEAPGRYDIRLHDTDSDGNELAFVVFTVR